MTEMLNQALSLIVLIQAGFVLSTTVTVLIVYARHERALKRHILCMMASYICLTGVIAYNVVFGYVTMPLVTALAAIAGFVVGDIGLTRYMLSIKLHDLLNTD